MIVVLVSCLILAGALIAVIRVIAADGHGRTPPPSSHQAWSVSIMGAELPSSPWRSLPTHHTEPRLDAADWTGS